MYTLGDFGCCGDVPGLGNMPWGYLGDDTSDPDFVGPQVPDDVTVQDVNDYVTTGTISNSFNLDAVAKFVQTAGASVQSILQQVQLGQIVGSTPVNSLPAYRAAITGQGTPLSATVSSMFANPTILIAAATFALLLFRKK
jgi:hypothetical protein